MNGEDSRVAFTETKAWWDPHAGGTLTRSVLLRCCETGTWFHRPHGRSKPNPKLLEIIFLEKNVEQTARLALWGGGSPCRKSLHPRLRAQACETHGAPLRMKTIRRALAGCSCGRGLGRQWLKGVKKCTMCKKMLKQNNYFFFISFHYFLKTNC